MMRVLVTGGTGVLGQKVVSKLSDEGYTVRVMSRAAQPAGVPIHSEWAQANLETGEGVRQAVAGVHTIVHAASNPFRHTRQVDVEGTRRLVDAAKAGGIAHVIYISIVGVDRIPFYAYYRMKYEAEEMIAHGGVPWTVVRATQFHDLLDYALGVLTRIPVAFVPTDLPFQPIDSGEVADALCRCVAKGPAGQRSEMGGPEVLTGRAISRTWLDARGIRRMVLPLHLPGKAAQAFRRGAHTCPDQRQGKIIWREWVALKYPAQRHVRSGYER